MKRFITISLLAAATLSGKACGWLDSHNYYMFSAYDSQEFRDRVERATDDNWKAYLGVNDEYFFFDADEAIAVARRKQDALMVSYIQQLQRYLACAEEKRQERWDYPTKAQLAKRRQTLQSVRTYAQSKLKTRLRSQHALLLMRCNMMLGQHQANVQFYQQTGSKLIESVYRDMMRNIYAGALLKTGHDVEAARIFAEQGDYASLMTQYYKRRSCAAIRQEYQRDPNSAVLPFLLQDFVNNTQEAIDGQIEGNPGGKLFIRDISQQEAQQMCQLCQEAVGSGKTSSPVLWQSAKAWLEYLLGRRAQAVASIGEAVKMEGTARMKDNARALHLFITAAEMPAGTALDNLVAQELQWLDEKKADDQHFARVIDRLTHQVLVGKYKHRPVETVALLRATDCSLYQGYIDTMQVERLQRYLDYTEAAPRTALDRYLQPRQHVDRTAMDDLVGTKYLRRCQWQQACTWLDKVPLTYYNKKGYAVYAANRKFTVEPWMKRQWLKEGMEYSDQQWNLTSNPKTDFARQMMALEAQERLATGDALCQNYYTQATLYAQATFTGDCWFIMSDGKSISDSVRVNEADLAARARQLLDKVVSTTTSQALRERALFARCYGELYPKRWFDYVWNPQTYEDERRVNRQSPQYRAFAVLADHERQQSQPAADYVSRCDEYRQFLKHYR